MKPSSKLSCAIVIPAFNEAPTVATVVRVALQSQLGRVIVVDDASTDNTAEQATLAGAEVVRLAQNLGKAGAVVTAVSSLDADVIVLLDADLLKLTADHIRALADPVLSGQVDMTRGDFKGGRWQTHLSQQLSPVLNGQRALFKEKLLSIPELATSRYGMEVAIAKTARREAWRVAHVPLQGVSQVLKEEKSSGFWAGLLQRVLMYRDILKVMVSGYNKDADKPR